MEKRIAMCAHKGFDGVEPDNIAGWENKTGFPLTRADQRRYNLWIARQVHKRGMAVALKNDPGQAKELGFSAIRKGLELFATPCEPLPSG